MSFIRTPKPNTRLHTSRSAERAGVRKGASRVRVGDAVGSLWARLASGRIVSTTSPTGTYTSSMAYQPDFSGVRAKMDRGSQHAAVLNDETGYVYDAQHNPVISPFNRIPLRLEYEPDTGYHVLRATARHSEQTVRRWGLITGDAVHNYRSALDHLTWQLACHKTGGENLPGVSEGEARNVQFPLDDKPPAHGDARRFREGGYLKHVLPEHREIIYQHQPFGNRFNFGHEEVHPFTGLRKLSNGDKHRLITPIAVLADRFMGLQVSPFGSIEGEVVETDYSGSEEWPAKPDAEIMRVKLAPESIRLNMDEAGYLTPTPSFQDPISNGITYVRSVYIELMNIAFQISAVVDEFEYLFKPGSAPPPALRPSARGS